MRLSVQAIKNFYDINSFEVTDVAHIQEGQSNEIIFRLLNLDKNGLRHVPSSSATMTVYLSNIDNSRKLTLDLTIKDIKDSSVWSVDIDGINNLPASGDALFTLIDGGKTYKFVVQNIISVSMLNSGAC